ncbi:UNVERIFIED_CONTAM: glucose-6-phosphate dehydrogenase, partial [Lactiplantibacillus plantarum]|nr:glucose-6-phosphate dehydrogenase [Lactiplantibacillus plantarum]
LRSLGTLKPEEVATNLVRGKYGAGDDAKAYRDEDKISSDSNTDTFVAGKVMIDNYRWSGVPFYIRTGKRLADKFTRIDVVFKRPGVNIFNHEDVRANDDAATSLDPNILTIKVEPTKGVEHRMNAKAIDQGFGTPPVTLNYFRDA